MKTSDFYAVAPLAPVNKTAGQVTSRGDVWEPKIHNSAVRTYAPLPVFQITPAMRKGPDFHDLTGRKFGRLTVIGYGGKGQRSKGGRWVCRCICGTYTYRYKKGLVNFPADGIQACAECEKLHDLRRQSVSGVKRRT